MKKLNQSGNTVIAGIVSAIGGVIVTILTLRLVLRVLAANPYNGFVHWVYATSQFFNRPFLGIFNHSTVGLSRGSFELSTALAIVVYGIATSLLVDLLGGLRR